MILAKLVDRIAIAAMFAVSVAVPLASLTPLAAHAGMSAPSSSIALPNGGERRFYTSGPAGTRTLRVDVSADGKVLASRQVLDDDYFRQIAPGMKGSDVLALIGPPYAKTRFEATKTTSWDYHYEDAWNYDSEFSVIVDDAGTVVSKFSARNDQ